MAFTRTYTKFAITPKLENYISGAWGYESRIYELRGGVGGRSESGKFVVVVPYIPDIRC